MVAPKNPSVVRYHTGACFRVAIVRPGRALLHVVFMEDGPLRVRKLPAAEARYMQPLPFRDGPYPLRRAVRLFREHGKVYGTTRATARFLRAVRP